MRSSFFQACYDLQIFAYFFYCVNVCVFLQVGCAGYACCVYFFQFLAVGGYFGDFIAYLRVYCEVQGLALVYGMSAFGLAQNLGVARSVAANYIEQYFARYPKVAKYMEETRLAAHRDGFVETAFGRRLWLPDIRSARAQMRAAAERAAINAPMQGTAADLIKMAMTAVSRWLTENKLESRMVLQVHDELVLEVPEKEVAAVSEALPRLMASVASLSVPLIAQVGVADNWEAAH